MTNSTIVQSFAQLEKLNWVKTETRKLIADNGCILSIATEFHANQNKETVQVTLTLFKGDKKVWGWGSENNAQNDQIVKWFYHNYYEIINKKIESDILEINELKKQIFTV